MTNDLGTSQTLIIASHGCNHTSVSLLSPWVGLDSLQFTCSIPRAVEMGTRDFSTSTARRHEISPLDLSSLNISTPVGELCVLSCKICGLLIFYLDFIGLYCHLSLSWWTLNSSERTGPQQTWLRLLHIQRVQVATGAHLEVKILNLILDFLSFSQSISCLRSFIIVAYNTMVEIFRFLDHVVLGLCSDSALTHSYNRELSVNVAPTIF